MGLPCGLGFWGGLRGGVGCKLPPYPPKEKRCARNNIKWERGASKGKDKGKGKKGKLNAVGEGEEDKIAEEQ